MCCTLTLFFIYRIIKQGSLLKAYTDELTTVIGEAQDVKRDLVDLMDDALSLSQTLIDDLDTRIAGNGTYIKDSADFAAVVNDDELQLEYPDKVVKFNPGSSSRIRVYDLARELHISSSELVIVLQGCGLKITSHMNLIDAEQARALINKADYPTDAIDVPSAQPGTQNGESFDNEAAFLASLQLAHPYMAVSSLYEKGYPIWQIAKILGRGQGEINLILNLSNKKAGSL